MRAAVPPEQNGADSQPCESAHQNHTPEDGMKVKLLARKGSNKAGSVVEYDPVSAQWLIEKGHAEAVKGSDSGDTDGADDKPARRGRPRKDES
jgi:hypothetical protein